MLSMGLNDNDLKRLTDKLKKLQYVTHELSNPNNPVNQYRYSILLTYKNAVVNAMGSVDAVDYESHPESHYHGIVGIDLKDLGSQRVTWRNLAPFTIEEKIRLGYSLKVWEASGTAKRAVRIHKETGFVGIDDSNREALEHAMRTELGLTATNGSKTPPRALFTIANEIVKSQKVAIAQRIKEIILAYVGWGT